VAEEASHEFKFHLWSLRVRHLSGVLKLTPEALLALITLALVGIGATSVWNAAHAAGGEADIADTASSSELSVVMTLYIGGITLGKIDLTSTLRSGQYYAVSNLETTGIINAFWKQMIQATSSGRIDGNSFRPAFYDAYAILDDNSKEEVSLTYDADAPPRLYVNPPFKDSVQIVVPDAEQKHALDPVSAIAFLTADFGSRVENPCDTIAPIFDGRRRYDIKLKKEADTNLNMDNDLYNGPTTQCSVEYRQISGPVQQVIKQKSALPVVHAWIARFPSRILGVNYYVPLRLWAQTPYGTVAGVVTSLTVDGTKPKAHRN
jgi:hypothetical protein